MSRPIIFSINELPGYPRLSSLYEQMGYQELEFTSVRRAINALKKYQPDVIIAQFLFSFSTNYASNHISNLDSLIISLQKYSDYKPKFIFLVNKKDEPYLQQLTGHYEGFSSSNHSLLLPVNEEQIKKMLLC